MSADLDKPADVNLRKFITDGLKALTPRGWKWLPYGTNLDTISGITCVLTLASITRFAAAPNTHRNVEYTLTILAPSTVLSEREDALDDAIVDLLGAIDQTKNLAWSSATRVLGGGAGQNLGYDITVTFPIEKTGN